VRFQVSCKFYLKLTSMSIAIRGVTVSTGSDVLASINSVRGARGMELRTKGMVVANRKRKAANSSHGHLLPSPFNR
jgi:hypothetical protein